MLSISTFEAGATHRLVLVKDETSGTLTFTYQGPIECVVLRFTVSPESTLEQAVAMVTTAEVIPAAVYQQMTAVNRWVDRLVSIFR